MFANAAARCARNEPRWGYGVSIDLTQVPQIVSTLAGVVIGAILGVLANMALERFKEGRRNVATRAQLVSLIRVVEARMSRTGDQGTGPLEQWISIELLSTRVFSTEAASLLHDSVADEVYTGTVELHQVRAAIEDAQKLHAELRQDMAHGDKYQTGPALIVKCVREVQAAAHRGVVVCETMRRLLGDSQPIDLTASNLGRGYDQLAAARFAEAEARSISEQNSAS